MDLERIESLLKLLSAHDVSEFHYRDGEQNLRLRLGPPPAPASPVTHLTASAPAPVAPPVHAPEAPPAAKAPAAASDAGLVIVSSPMVGTFYRSPSPGAPNFVDVGQAVAKGKTLCIVEAMKLMNEIESEVNGVVVEIMLENAQPVQFGQPLLKIRPA
jgi:acetyl-CoA carboxylase biotin carboxyl carrier protein